MNPAQTDAVLALLRAVVDMKGIKTSKGVEFSIDDIAELMTATIVVAEVMGVAL